MYEIGVGILDIVILSYELVSSQFKFACNE